MQIKNEILLNYLYFRRVLRNPRCLPNENEVPIGLFFTFKENHFNIKVITSSGFINK